MHEHTQAQGTYKHIQLCDTHNQSCYLCEICCESKIKKKSCSQSRQQIYFCKILHLCVITELKVKPGDKITHASFKDNKHNTAFLHVHIHTQ